MSCSGYNNIAIEMAGWIEEEESRIALDMQNPYAFLQVEENYEANIKKYSNMPEKELLELYRLMLYKRVIKDEERKYTRR
jgi:hypothetical protein